MRNAYRGFYPPTEQELDELWRNGFLTFDANVLLNLYRLPSSKDYLSTFAELKEQLWLPHQAGLEYHSNRISVINEMRTIYRSMEEAMNSALATWQQRFPRHPSIDLKKAWAILGAAIDEVQGIIRQAENEHRNLEQDDPIRDQLANLFSGMVGPPFSDSELNELYKEGERRYMQGIPPGYKDADKEKEKKPHPRAYGDFILWRQVCNEAKQRRRPVILITDDRKDDWWLRYSGKTIGPRPELVAELWQRAEVPFHMYSSEQFLHFADRYLQKSGQLRQVEEEARSLREDDERKLQEPAAASLKPIIEYMKNVNESEFGQNLRTVLEAVRYVDPWSRFTTQGATSDHGFWARASDHLDPVIIRRAAELRRERERAILARLNALKRADGDVDSLANQRSDATDPETSSESSEPEKDK